jgi:hypothetical protein
MLVPALVAAVILLPLIRLIRLQKIYQFLSTKLYFGFFIGLFMKSYMNIGICTILVVRKAYRGDLKDGDLPNFWASGGTFGILILAPIFFGFFLSINNQRLDDPEFLQTYGALYSNLNFSRPFSLLTPSLILLRRFILIISLAFLGEYPWAQLMVASISS